MSSFAAATAPLAFPAQHPIHVQITSAANAALLKFTLSHVDVSYANAIRRTLLSNIPMVVFKTRPYAESLCHIPVNTSRLHNEIIKQRLSCIPVHLNKKSSPFAQQICENLAEYSVEIHVDNPTDACRTITSRDFKVRHIPSDVMLTDAETRRLFPPFVPIWAAADAAAAAGSSSVVAPAEYFIELVTLNPTVSADLPGEELKLSCGLSIGTARQNSAFNATATCAFQCTPDTPAIHEKATALATAWDKEGRQNVEFEKKNWLLLEGKRIVVPDSFDFVVETVAVGAYENRALVLEACDFVKRQVNAVTGNPATVKIRPTDDLAGSHDIVLEGELDILGHMLRYEMFRIFYQATNDLTFVGYHKAHPHDNFSVVRVALARVTDEDCAHRIRRQLVDCCAHINHNLDTIKRLLDPEAAATLAPMLQSDADADTDDDSAA